MNLISTILLASCLSFLNPVLLEQTVLKIYGGYATLDSNFPMVNNLFDYLTNFALSRCLIIIDNHYHIPLANQPIGPIILRGFRQYWLFGDFNDTYATGPWKFSAPNMTSKTLSIFSCPLSNLFNDFDLNHDQEFCLQLNYTRYHIASRQQNCKVQVAFFSEDHSILEDFFQAGRRLEFPNLPYPLVRIYVINGRKPSTLEIFYAHLRREVNEIQLVTFLSVSEQIANSALMRSSANITKVEIWRYQRDYWSAEPFTDSDSSIPLQKEDLSIKSIIDSTLPQPNANLLWEFHESAAKETIFWHMGKVLDNCALNLFDSRLLMSPVERVAQGYATTWVSIIANYTILHSTSPHKVMCSHGIKITTAKHDELAVVRADVVFKFIPLSKGHGIVPYNPPGVQTDLRFVSCGRQSTNALSWQELVNIYDKKIWVMIFLSTASVIAVAAILNNVTNINITRFSLSTLKVLLEQSDTRFHQKDFRKVTALFILTGIILSNGYKNSNVYNMIAVRKPVPYEYVQELIKDNFTLYTRLDSVKIFEKVNGQVILRELETTGGSYIVNDEDDSYAVAGISEVAAAMRNHVLTLRDPILPMSTEVDNFGRLVISSTTSTRLNSSGVLQSSRLMNIVKKEINDLSPHTIFLASIITKTLDKVTYEIRKLEENEMYDSIKDCRKVGLILPEYLCHKYARRLQHETDLSDIYVGKDTFTEVKWQISLEGLWNRHIVNRFKMAYETGHWQKWAGLFKIPELDNNVRHPAAANISGNVVIIFVAWAGGILVATLAFNFERFKASNWHIAIGTKICYSKWCHFGWSLRHSMVSVYCKTAIFKISTGGRPKLEKKQAHSYAG